MCQLTGLWYFDVKNNSLTGGTSQNIGNCTSFQVLDLSYNKLNGEIPFNIGFLQVAAIIGEVLRKEEFPEVKVDFQETFLGHTSPISRCCFSASGMNIASASVDGTVRIWTYESSTPTSRNATIYCGAEIMSLD